MKNSYAMIFKEFCPHQMQTIIKEHPEYDSIINNPLKLMDSISLSMHELIWAIYPYLSLIEYLAIMVDTR